MKKLATTLCLSLLILANVSAQGTRNEDKTFSVNPRSQELVLDLPFGSLIRVVAWDKPQVKFEAAITINDGELDEAVEFDYEEKATAIYIEMDLNKKMIQNYRGAWTQEDCEDGQGGYWNWEGDGDSRSFVCMKVYYTVYMPAGMELSVETINADVELRGLNGNTFVKAINGDVDMDWNPSLAADFTFKSIHGDLYSDLDLESSSGDRGGFGLSYSARLRGGGDAVRLETINSNIYLRKRG